MKQSKPAIIRTKQSTYLPYSMVQTQFIIAKAALSYLTLETCLLWLCQWLVGDRLEGNSIKVFTARIDKKWHTTAFMYISLNYERIIDIKKGLFISTGNTHWVYKKLVQVSATPLSSIVIGDGMQASVCTASLEDTALSKIIKTAIFIKL